MNKEVKELKNKLQDFKSVEELQDHIKKNGTDDFIQLKGIVYTMEEYDMEGKQVTYANKKNNKGFFVKTENRYGENKFKDAVVEFDNNWGFFRNDIVYIE